MLIAVGETYGKHHLRRNQVGSPPIISLFFASTKIVRQFFIYKIKIFLRKNTAFAVFFYPIFLVSLRYSKN